MKAVLGILVAALLLPTLASAQTESLPLDITLAVEDRAAPIPYSGSGTFAFNVTVGCLGILRSMSETQAAAATVTATAGTPARNSAAATPAMVRPVVTMRCSFRVGVIRPVERRGRGCAGPESPLTRRGYAPDARFGRG